jgi:predicted rRNA methylase YqxC with S4 and FtsJ domains
MGHERGPRMGPRRIDDVLIEARIADRRYHARALIIKKLVKMDGIVVRSVAAVVPPGRHTIEVHARSAIHRISADGGDDFRV